VVHRETREGPAGCLFAFNVVHLALFPTGLHASKPVELPVSVTQMSRAIENSEPITNRPERFGRPHYLLKKAA
jgi:hypothetical protein